MGINIIGTPVYKEKKNNNKFIVNAILIFMCVYGSVTYLLSALEIEYYGIIVFPVLAIIAYACALLHKSRKHKVWGYIILLAVFVVFVLSMSVLINSGFSHFLNVLYQTVDTKYVLNIDKEYAEYFTNSTLTVTILAITVGYAFSIVVNMMISESMNAFAVTFIEVCFMVIPLYFGKDASALSCLMVVVAPVAVLAIKNSNKYDVTENDVSYCNPLPKTWGEKVFRLIFKEGKNSFENRYTRKGYLKCRIMPAVIARQTAVVVLAGVAAAGVIHIIVPHKLTDGVSNPVEGKLRYKVQEFAMYGIGIFFPSENETIGGMMNGQIFDGNIIRFDNNEDLRVQFVPINKERVLLRGYVGTYYTGSAWVTTEQKAYSETKVANDIYGLEWYLSQRGYSDLTDDIYDLTASELKEKQRLYEAGKSEEGSYWGNMTISITDMLAQGIYLPYYTYVNDSGVENDLSGANLQADQNIFLAGQENPDLLDGKYTLSFYRQNSRIGESILEEEDGERAEYYKKLEALYSDYVKRTYLDNISVAAYAAQEFMKSYGLDTVYGDRNFDEYYEDVGFDYTTEMNAALKLAQIFQKDYTYTHLPGSTPKGKDYAQYFLLENKKGYCVHFATSAVIILRQMGIPARYVEGYAIDPDSWEDEPWDEEYYGVVEASITDASAHAWIEIYADGIGWVPVDITPASDEDETDDNDGQTGILSFLNNIAGGAAAAGAGLSGILGIIGDNTPLVAVLLMAILIFLILVWTISIYIGHVIRIRVFNGDDCDKAVTFIAEYALKLLKYAGFDGRDVYTFGECARQAKNAGKIELADAINILAPIQKLVYGGYSLSQEERCTALAGVKALSVCIYKNQKWYKKLKFLFLKRLTVI